MSTYYYTNELYHHGIKGQKWGQRNYQNADGSLTPEGYQRYYGNSSGEKKGNIFTRKDQYTNAQNKSGVRRQLGYGLITASTASPNPLTKIAGTVAGSIIVNKANKLANKEAESNIKNGLDKESAINLHRYGSKTIARGIDDYAAKKNISTADARAKFDKARYTGQNIVTSAALGAITYASLSAVTGRKGAALVAGLAAAGITGGVSNALMKMDNYGQSARDASTQTVEKYYRKYNK